MDRYGSDDGPTPEYRLSRDAAREVARGTGATRDRPDFLSTDHLSTEAAAAYVDGRLPNTGQVRADAHLARCPQCRREVTDQREARRALRGSGPIQMPRELLERLRSLEDEPRPGPGQPGPGTPAGTAPGDPWTRLLRRLRRRGR